VSYGTAAGTAAQGNDARITGAAQVANNLSDMASAATARANVDQGLTTLTYATTITPTVTAANCFTVTLTGNATLANPTGLKAGAHYMFVVKQDTTGSRTLSFGTAYKWQGGTAPALTTAASATDIISAISDGTNLYCVITKGF
jgi:hypothetical protein